MSRMRSYLSSIYGGSFIRSAMQICVCFARIFARHDFGSVLHGLVTYLAGSIFPTNGVVCVASQIGRKSMFGISAQGSEAMPSSSIALKESSTHIDVDPFYGSYGGK